MIVVTVSTRKFGCQTPCPADLARLKQKIKASCPGNRIGRFGTSCVRTSAAFGAEASA